MSILPAISLAQLQIFRHFLQELENEKVPTLSEARRLVASEEHARHAKRQAHKRGRHHNNTIPCPECGKPIEHDIIVDDVVVQGCKHCRWSGIIDGGR